MASICLGLNVLTEDCINSIANALELLQSCTKPSIYAVRKNARYTFICCNRYSVKQVFYYHLFFFCKFYRPSISICSTNQDTRVLVPWLQILLLPSFPLLFRFLPIFSSIFQQSRRIFLFSRPLLLAHCLTVWGKNNNSLAQCKTAVTSVC